MRIQIICPQPGKKLYGNRVTADRWAAILKGLGHRVRMTGDYRGEACDLLLALHAGKSAQAVLRFRRWHPATPVILALTGTDLYRDLARQPRARRALAAADRLVVLQPRALRSLPAGERRKARVIFQSAEKTRLPRGKSRPATFDVCVVGHLRPEKDSFRTALAARRLPKESKIRILQVGAARAPETARQARAEEKRNLRYRWVGPLPRGKTRRVLAASRVTVVSSRMEGGANVIVEAAVDSVPVLASRIPGNLGMLGEGYPGYFRLGDTRGLAHLLRRAETLPKFRLRLRAWMKRRAPLFHPARERAAWRKLLGELRRPV